MDQSILNFERAIGVDPKFARAYAGLATALQLSPFFGGTPPDEVKQRTINAARRALELDSSLADAHVALGSVYAFAGQWDSSDVESRHALSLEPDNAEGRQTFGRVLIARGKVEDGLDQLREAAKVERVSPVISAWLAYGFFLIGRTDSALAESDRALQLDPGILPVRNLTAQINVALGQRDVARRIADAGSATEMSTAAYVYARLGDTASAFRVVRSMEGNKPPPWYAVATRATVLLAIRDTAAALSELERSSQVAGAAWMTPFSLVDPIYDPIRQSPRFAALLRSTTLDPRMITGVRRTP